MKTEAASSSQLVATAAIAAVAGGAWWVRTLGPVPGLADVELSTQVLDRNGRLLRAYATPEGRWRLPATVNDVDPRFVEMLQTYEDRRFRKHRGVDPLAMMRAAGSIHRQWPRHLRRLDLDHAGRAAARAARPNARSAPSFARSFAPSRSSAA